MTLIARLRIILNDVEPMPMRHIEVPLKIRLDRLHEVIQAAMGWTDTHLYEFDPARKKWTGVRPPCAPCRPVIGSLSRNAGGVNCRSPRCRQRGRGALRPVWRRRGDGRARP